MTLIRRENHLLDVQFGIIIDVELACERQTQVHAARTVNERRERSFGLNSHRPPAGFARRTFNSAEIEFAQLKRILRLARRGLGAISLWISPEVAQARSLLRQPVLCPRRARGRASRSSCGGLRSTIPKRPLRNRLHLWPRRLDIHPAGDQCPIQVHRLAVFALRGDLADHVEALVQVVVPAQHPAGAYRSPRERRVSFHHPHGTSGDQSV